MVKKFRFDEFGYEVEVGKLARQANGSVWLQQGGTVLLATAVSAPSKEFPGFLPLTTDYREYYSAAGKIPGGYYKREGKPSDREVLTGRLVDRALRPLFPEHFFDQVQVIVSVYSVDKKHSPNSLALLAGSLALTLSDIPFMGPVGVVEMGRLHGKWAVNPVYEDAKQSDVRLVVAGNQDGICMVEGALNQVSEAEVVEALFAAHNEIKKLVRWQEEIRQACGIVAKSVADPYQWNTWEERVSNFLTIDRVEKTYIEDKVARNEYLDAIRAEFCAPYAQEMEETKVPQKVVDYIFDLILKKKVTDFIFRMQKRIDGRAYDSIRPIEVETGLLPCTHGSALFVRGRTQALVSVTLGSGEDVQRFEPLMEEEEGSSNFMLHYNFPPFSVGEVRQLRGTSRREVGHGHLAASAFRFMLPTSDTFPYTIRLVSDILESDGSSSMATACGSTMALMHAGVPINNMVSGIAMGLLHSSDGAFQVISDISGFEDAYGLMDFKVAGTRDGITAIQMDIKYKGGLPRSVFESALAQACQGRLHILREMEKVMAKPNTTLSELVPKVRTLRIDTDKIGMVIGKGGETIREITGTTKTNIDIEPDGQVKIFGVPGADIERAVRWIETLTGQIKIGDVFHGKVRRIAEFGLFVELVPGQDGLVHVSNIPQALQRVFGKKFQPDDEVEVEVVNYDNVTGKIGLRLRKSPYES